MFVSQFDSWNYFIYNIESIFLMQRVSVAKTSLLIKIMTASWSWIYFFRLVVLPTKQRRPLNEWNHKITRTPHNLTMGQFPLNWSSVFFLPSQEHCLREKWKSNFTNPPEIIRSPVPSYNIIAQPRTTAPPKVTASRNLLRLDDLVKPRIVPPFPLTLDSIALKFSKLLAKLKSILTRRI